MNRLCTFYIVVAHDDKKVWAEAYAPLLSAHTLRLLPPEYILLVDEYTPDTAAIFGSITAQPVIYVLTDDQSVADDALVQTMDRLRARTRTCKIVLRVTAQNESKTQQAADAVVEIAKQGMLAATAMAVAKQFVPPE